MLNNYHGHIRGTGFWNKFLNYYEKKSVSTREAICGVVSKIRLTKHQTNASLKLFFLKVYLAFEVLSLSVKKKKQSLVKKQSRFIQKPLRNQQNWGLQIEPKFHPKAVILIYGAAASIKRRYKLEGRTAILFHLTATKAVVRQLSRRKAGKRS